MGLFAIHPLEFIRRHVTFRYGIALAAVAASAEIRWLLNPVLGDNGPFLLFMPGVMLVAMVCGLGPGLLASLLAALAGVYLWGGPQFSFVIGSYDELVQAVSAIVVGSAITVLSHHLQRLRRSEQSANMAKNRFFAVLSHELRQPMAPIMAAIDTLQSGQAASEAERRDAIDVIRRNVSLHSRLVEDLLDVNRIAAGKLSLDRRAHDLYETLRLSADACMPEIRQRKLRLEMQLEGQQVFVNGDPVRLQQVFWNLLRNATKFTPEGGAITLRSTVIGQSIRVDVRDTGIGIGQDKLRILFADFKQAHGEVSTRLGGLGLGLAICRGVVHLHGGEILAASDGPGKGATFSVILPTCPAPQSPPVRRHAVAGKRLLLVDDQPDALRLLAKLLRGAGYVVNTADGVNAAIEAARDGVDLLITDMQLGDGTGAELLNRLREQSPVKAICISGAADPQDISRDLESGFCRHVPKPVAFPQLRQAIEEVLSEPNHAAQ